MTDTQTKTLAIEINSPEVWELICALDPHTNELSFEENLGSFLAINFEGSRWAIMSPETVGKHFDHLEPAQLKVKTVNLVR